MRTKNNEIKFDTELLLNDVNKVIQNGINKLLCDYIDNYKLYEETHHYIMNLPCIKRGNSRMGLNNNVVCNKTDFSGEEHDIDIVLLDKYLSDKDDSSQEETESDTSEDNSSEDNTLLINAGKLIKQHEKTIETRDKEIADLKKRLDFTQDQNDKRYDMFYQQKDLYEELIKKYVKEIEDLKNQLKDCIKKPLICDLTADEPEKEFVEIKQEKMEVEEKENITLHIEETEVEEPNEEELDDEEEEQDDEELDDEEEVVDEDEEVVDEEEKEDVDEEKAVAEEQDEEVVDEEEEDEDKEVDEEDDAVETENSSTDKESQKEDDEKDEDEEQELIEIEIDDVLYCTENEENGFIYEIDEEGNVGEPVGYFKNGEPFFN